MEPQTHDPESPSADPLDVLGHFGKNGFEAWVKQTQGVEYRSMSLMDQQAARIKAWEGLSERGIEAVRAETQKDPDTITLSPSTLSLLTKCGVKYQKEKIEKLPEPGKDKFHKLLGTTVDTAIAYCADGLNQHKGISLDVIAENFWLAIQKEFMDPKRGMEPHICEHALSPIRNLILQGDGTGNAGDVDRIMELINTSERWEYPIPKTLKDGSFSTDKRRPPLSTALIKAFQDLCWFFNPDLSPVYTLIRNAAKVEAQVVVESLIPEAVFNQYQWKNKRHQYKIVGHLDLLVTAPNGQETVIEFKYGKTEFTGAFVRTHLQSITYGALKNAPVWLMDVGHQQGFWMEVSAEMGARSLMQYVNGFRMVENQIFIPACGTDPYNTGLMLCRFKDCGLCEFAPGDAA